MHCTCILSVLRGNTLADNEEISHSHYFSLWPFSYGTRNRIPKEKWREESCITHHCQILLTELLQTITANFTENCKQYFQLELNSFYLSHQKAEYKMLISRFANFPVSIICNHVEFMYILCRIWTLFSKNLVNNLFNNEFNMLHSIIYFILGDKMQYVVLISTKSMMCMRYIIMLGYPMRISISGCQNIQALNYFQRDTYLDPRIFFPFLNSIILM
jgi:hypothetical protein